jgi:hypothetical protein
VSRFPFEREVAPAVFARAVAVVTCDHVVALDIRIMQAAPVQRSKMPAGLGTLRNVTSAQKEPHTCGGEAVRLAAARSLNVRGLRVYRTRVRQANGSWTAPWSWEVGVASPATRSVQLCHFIAEGSPVDRLAKAAEHRWPWLSDDRSFESPGTDMETIEIGRRLFIGGPGGWGLVTARPFYGPKMALWALEALLATIRASPSGSADVRGEPCVRYLGEALPGEIAGQDGIVLVDEPAADDAWRLLATDVSVDAEGFVRRVAWSPRGGPRKRGVLDRLDKRFGSGHGPTGSLWEVTEFWAYGCHVEISAPSELIDPSTVSLADIVRETRAAKREYKRKS